MKVVHVTRSDAFAGTERYAAEVCRRLALLGHDVTLIGGEPRRTTHEAGADVRWLPGATTAAAARSLLRVGRADVVHAHLTAGEVAALSTRWRHRGRVIATRHIAATRGSGLKRVLAPVVARGIDHEIAISRTVDAALGRPADEVLHNGVRSRNVSYDPNLRTVLVLQRLEPEKRTDVAVEAWRLARLWEQGWRLVIAGDGSQRDALVSLADGLPGVDLCGLVEDVEPLLRQAGIVLAPADHEPLGLTVLEAMSWARPVVASRSGGHLETLPSDAPMFTPGQAQDAAARLQEIAGDAERRCALGAALQRRQRTSFTVEEHVDRLLEAYGS